MTFNPAVLWMEIHVRLKEKKTWVVSLLYVVSLAMMSIAPLIAVGRFTVEAPAQTGFSLGMATTVFVLILLVILTPLAAAGRLSQEREQRTLAGLLNTPLSYSDIVLGKLIGTWAFAAWLAALSVPFIAVVMLWGGMDVTLVLINAAWIAGVVIVTGAIGLGLSGYFSRSLNSYLGTGAALFFWMAAWPLFGMVSLQSFRPTDVAAAKKFDLACRWIFFAHNPFAVLTHTFAPDALSWGPPALVWSAMTVFFIALAIRGLRRGITDR